MTGLNAVSSVKRGANGFGRRRNLSFPLRQVLTLFHVTVLWDHGKMRHEELNLDIEG